jgi:hypothetical protein
MLCKNEILQNESLCSSMKLSLFKENKKQLSFHPSTKPSLLKKWKSLCSSMKLSLKKMTKRKRAKLSFKYEPWSTIVEITYFVKFEYWTLKSEPRLLA